MKGFCFAFLIFVLVSPCRSGECGEANEPIEPNWVSEPNDANYPDDANELLRMKWDAVIAVLRSEDLDQEAKEDKIAKVISPVFDFALMAKLSLGRKHWPKLTPLQRERFTRLFEQRLKVSYLEKVGSYSGEEVLFKPAVRKKKALYIPVELFSEDTRVDMLYKLHRAEERRKVKVNGDWTVQEEHRWKIYDMEIQGVSILLTYRSQFDDILSTGSVDDLLSRLEQPPSS